MREAPPVVRARTPPRRNREEVVITQARDGRMEENFGWVGASASVSMSTQPEPQPSGFGLGSGLRKSSAVKFDTSAAERQLQVSRTEPPFSNELGGSQSELFELDPPTRVDGPSERNQEEVIRNEPSKGGYLDEDFGWVGPSTAVSQTKRESPYRSPPAMAVPSKGAEIYRETFKNENTTPPIIAFSAVPLERHNAIQSGPVIGTSRDITDEKISKDANTAMVKVILDGRRASETRANLARASIPEVGVREVERLREAAFESKSSSRTFCCF